MFVSYTWDKKSNVNYMLTLFWDRNKLVFDVRRYGFIHTCIKVFIRDHFYNLLMVSNTDGHHLYLLKLQLKTWYASNLQLYQT